MNPSVGIPVCKAMNRQCFHPLDRLTEYEQCLGSATNMYSMFRNIGAFNQPLDLVTAKVTHVRVYLFVVQPK